MFKGNFFFLLFCNKKVIQLFKLIDYIQNNTNSWGWSPSWAGVGHAPTGKIKKFTTVSLFCEILNNLGMI